MITVPQFEYQYQEQGKPAHSGRVRPANDFIAFKREALEQSIPQRFAQQVRTAPQRLAVKTRTQQLTYEQLDAESDHLANALLEALGREEEPVALLFDQSASFAVALLGLLKAGKICVPLDPSYPRERLAHMLADSQARLIVTDTKNHPVARPFAQSGCQILTADELNSRVITKQLDIHTSPDTLASIVYTSGSTGQPKGVTQNHRNLLHTVMNFTNTFHICADDRITTLSSPGSVGLLWFSLMTWLNGAAFFPVNIKEDGASSIANWLMEQEITVLFSVSPVYRHFVRALSSEQCFAKIRLVVIGGDRNYPKDVELYRQHFSENCLLGSGIGLTEVGRLAQYLMDKRTPIVDGHVPVGYPMDGMEVSLFDETGAEVGPGEVGEIVVKSRYLSPGYWRQSDLTTATFRPDPNGGPERLYFTGDLGRRLPDGCLLHLGRVDSQVKIRGHRVELSEIERAILSMPEIADAAVTTYENEPGALRLVAYVVPATDPPISRKALRDFLNRQLPDHMIPWRFVTMGALPLGRTGKVDRDALPAPHGRPRSDETLQISPRNAVEIHVKKIWEDLLALSDIGVREDFFELGGDSLLALDMVLQLEQMFGKTLPFDAFWSEGATIEGLARILQSGEGARIWERAVPIKPHGTRPTLFVVHTTGGHLSDYLWFARYLSPDQPVYGLQARGLDGRSRPDTSIESMAAHCLRKMQDFQPDGPYRLAGYSSGGLIASEMARMINEVGGIVAPLILLDVEIPSFRVSHLGHLIRDVCRLKNLRALQERSYHLILHTLGLDHLRNLRQVGESHRWAYWSYRPKPNPGQAVLFITKNDDNERANRMASNWRSLMRAGLEIEFIEGDHLSMMREPCVAELADRVQRKLDYFAGKVVT